ncbi:imidazole glycerol phosphate synthase subunit HisH [Synechococcus sp. AH-551-C10]|nr:imidazole glycerol phosphate synthase subunit HisH [Synechococcus sp. AH-551-C10]MDB4659648.1 imidazole glycerol phosphate synthase subunit HisH [Synechococcus sp. AH-551-C10]
MIGIVDYGLGNVHAFANIYKRLNIPATLVSNAESLAQIDHIILPGVGSFDWAMQRLERNGLRQMLDQQVLEKKVPVLGVCIGMQIMARTSEEGSEPGLGWIDAEVRRFSFTPDNQQLILPHMGWNDVESVQSSGLLYGLTTNSQFYFLHSYYFSPDKEADVIATAYYGDTFACSVQAGNCYGVQFHPEKSHGWGIQLLKNFAEV